MSKEKILEEITQLSAEGHLTKDELLKAFDDGKQEDKILAASPQSKLSKIFYYIGGAIVFIGVTTLIGQNWESLTPFAKIATTLGLGIISFTAAVGLHQQEKLQPLSQSFFFISGLLMPLGMHITLDIAGFNVGTHGMQTLISGILFLSYLVSYFLYQRTVLLIFSILFASWLFFAMTEFIYIANPVYASWKFYCYRLVGLSLSYLLLGYYLSENDSEKKTLANWLSGVGTFAFLGSTISLGGWKPEQNAFWELVYPLLVFGFIYLSVYLKNKPFLIWGSLYLMAYISKITAEYFADSMGWALSLVFLGFLLIGVGYFAFYINRRYIKV